MEWDLPRGMAFTGIWTLNDPTSKCRTEAFPNASES